MEINEETGNLFEGYSESNIVGSIYDNDGNYYLIDKNKRLFLKDLNGKITEITDKQKILDVLELFRPGKTDVIDPKTDAIFPDNER